MVNAWPSNSPVWTAVKTALLLVSVDVSRFGQDRAECYSEGSLERSRLSREDQARIFWLACEIVVTPEG